MPKNRGRPPKLTPELVAKMADDLSLGMSDAKVAVLHDVHVDTLGSWRKIKWVADVFAKADAMRTRIRLQNIEDRVPHWQAIAWGLERNSPEHFARPEVRVQILNQMNVNNQSPAEKQAEKDFIWLQNLGPIGEITCPFTEDEVTPPKLYADQHFDVPADPPQLPAPEPESLHVMPDRDEHTLAGRMRRGNKRVEDALLYRRPKWTVAEATRQSDSHDQQPLDP
jgi:hypothetical protein